MDVAAVRYVVNLLLLLVLLWPKHRSDLWATQQTLPVIIRGLVLVIATITMALALRVMPVGETVAILYLSPFLVMLLAGPLLGEKVTPIMWIGAALGFTGVLLIVRPGGGLDTTGVILMLFNALLATAYHLMTRSLAKTETTIAMMFHSAAVGTAIFGAWFLATWHDFAPSAQDFCLMILLGALSTVGHFLFTSAYREAPASLLAPVNYMHLVWAGILGYVAFQHVPDGLSTLGMALILTAGIGTAIQSHFAKARA